MTDSLFFTDNVGVTTVNTDQGIAQISFLNGAFTTVNQSFHVVKSHNRSPIQKTRWQTIPGTTTPWRAPLGYSRRATDYIISSRGSFLGGSTFAYRWRDACIASTMFFNAMTNSGENKSAAIPISSAPPSGPEVDNLRKRAVTKALLDLADSKTTVGENLATARKTVDMLIDTVTDILYLARRLKRGRIFRDIQHMNVPSLLKAVKSGRIEKKAASTWLSYYYGYKPLAQDAYGLHELLKDILQTKALIVHGYGSGKYQNQSNYRGRDTNVQFPGILALDTIQFKAQCALYGTVDSSEYLRTINRAGLLNPVSLAWELIPFSFAIDWVAPIGDTLEALTATTGLTFRGGYTGDRWDRRTTVLIDGPWALDDSPTATFLSRGMTRNILTSFPRPQFYAKPFYQGADRWATISALFVSLFR